MSEKSFLGNIWKRKASVSCASEIKALFDEFFPKSQEFFSYEDLRDPFLLNGMKKAVDRLWNAIEKQERIMIFGDFDADGVTSTVVLVHALTALGAKVSYRIPDRKKDGHGLKPYLIDEIASKGVSLILTCDCAVNDAKEVEYASDIGIDVIITDHHEPESHRFPKKALAVINPKLSQEFLDSDLSGSAVSFKLIQALGAKVKKSQEFFDRYAEICAIGVIADCVPLVGENRKLVQRGLQQMKTTAWPGLQQLLENAGVEAETIDEETIGFVVAPRINAASRLGDVRIAVQLFLGNEADHSKRVAYLESLNADRKLLTNQTVEEARSQIFPENSCQVVFDPSWDQGVLGLMASRYVQELGMPIIACTTNESGMICASCRSPEGICMATALQKSQEFLAFFGGHAGAAGFVMEKTTNFEQLKHSLNAHFESQEIPEKKLEIFANVPLQVLRNEVADMLDKKAPFGVGNRRPIFEIQNFLVTDVLPLGNSGEHFKIRGNQDGVEADFVAFFADSYIDQIFPGKYYDFACEFRRKYWRGNEQFEYKVVDVLK